MNKNKQTRIKDEELAAAEKAGIKFISSKRGEFLCCQQDKNIIFIDKAVDGTFNPNNPDHVAHLEETLQKCYCKVCGTKYWAHYDLSKDKKLIRRVF